MIHTPAHRRGVSDSRATVGRLARLAPDDPRWLRTIAAHPDATIFHHPAWLGALAASYSYFPVVLAVYDPAGEIAAGLPLLRIRSPLTGRRWVALPFSDHCAPLATGPGALDTLTDGLVACVAAEQVPRIELRGPFPARPPLHTASPYWLHTVALDDDSRLVGRRFSGPHRQNIRTARKQGVRIVHGTGADHMRAFYALHRLTRHRKGVPVQPWRFFERLHAALIAPGMGFVLLAYKDDACIAGAVWFHWQRTLMCKYSASDENALDLRPNNLIFWTGLLWGCEHGCTVCDLGRTALDNAGLRDFKRGWGAVEQPLTYSTITRAAPCRAGSAAPTGTGRTAQLAQRLIRRAPPWVCQALGALLYRHVG